MAWSLALAHGWVSLSLAGPTALPQMQNNFGHVIEMDHTSETIGVPSASARRLKNPRTIVLSQPENLWLSAVAGCFGQLAKT